MGLADILFAAKVHYLDSFVSKQEGLFCWAIHIEKNFSHEQSQQTPLRKGWVFI